MVDEILNIFKSRLETLENKLLGGYIKSIEEYKVVNASRTAYGDAIEIVKHIEKERRRT